MVSINILTKLPIQLQLHNRKDSEETKDKDPEIFCSWGKLIMFILSINKIHTYDNYADP